MVFFLRKKWQFIISFSLAEKLDNICVIGTCIGVIGTDEMCDMLRVSEAMDIWEQLDMFNTIKRFITAEILVLLISLTINSHSSCSQLPDFYFAGTKFCEAILFPPIWFKFWALQASPRQHIQQSDALLCLTCAWLRAGDEWIIQLSSIPGLKTALV